LILLDHLDAWSGDARFFRNWTLAGIGFSDAAELFAFLSGFVFGRAYSREIDDHGFWVCQIRALFWSGRVYLCYLATAFLMILVTQMVGHFGIPTGSVLANNDSNVAYVTACDALCLKFQTAGLGILCMYVVILPLLPMMLALHRSSQWTAAGISAVAYLSVQIHPQINLRSDANTEWFFNPFAWQFLIVLGMICACRADLQRESKSASRCCVNIAAAVVICSLFLKLVIPVANSNLLEIGGKSIMSWIDRPELTAKPRLAPLRLLHFLSSACLMGLLMRRFESVFRQSLSRPFAMCGRHSLQVYCSGVVIACVGIVMLHWHRATSTIVLIVGLDACLLQWGIAELLELRRPPQLKPGRSGVDHAEGDGNALEARMAGCGPMGRSSL
jgi:hypothetical protein